MDEKVKKVMDDILDKFKSNDLPELISYAVFPNPNVPCSNYSFLNRTIIFMHGYNDCRGYAMWKEVERHVKKGEKSVHILAPRFLKKVNEQTETEETFLAGFVTVPLFDITQTEGKELPEYKDIELPELPFRERAMQWGISVKGIGMNNRYYGVYKRNTTKKEILLSSPETVVWLHELSHAGHDRLLNGNLHQEQSNFKEICAELAAAVLCNLIGVQPDRTLKNNYIYIEQYAKKWGKTPYNACLSVLKTVGQIVELIIHGDQQQLKQVA